jgi:hypothetical protein
MSIEPGRPATVARKRGTLHMVGLLVIGLLAGWVLLTDSRALQTFGSEAACAAAVTAFQAQARDGARWVEAQYRVAPTAFWSSAVQRAAAQIERARVARCVERGERP